MDLSGHRYLTTHSSVPVVEKNRVASPLQKREQRERANEIWLWVFLFGNEADISTSSRIRHQHLHDDDHDHECVIIVIYNLHRSARPFFHGFHPPPALSCTLEAEFNLDEFFADDEDDIGIYRYGLGMGSSFLTL